MPGWRCGANAVPGGTSTRISVSCRPGAKLGKPVASGMRTAAGGVLLPRLVPRKTAKPASASAAATRHRTPERLESWSDGEQTAQERQRAGLVQHLVQVAALRRLDTGGTTVVARAAGEHPRRVLDPALERLEAALCDPDAARMPVVHEHRRP